jgi:hypothetical protein
LKKLEELKQDISVSNSEESGNIRSYFLKLFDLGVKIRKYRKMSRKI